jgi:hypothetical protein
MVYCDCKYFATKKKRRNEDEIVEKSFVSGDRRGALFGQRGRDWYAERAGKRGCGAVGKCGK